MVSCLMGDSTALASAIVRCCLNNFTFIMPYTTKKCILGSNMKAVSHFKIM